MLVVSLLALREKEPLVDVMVNEIPRKNFVVGLPPRHKEIRIGKSAGSIFASIAL